MLFWLVVGGVGWSSSRSRSARRGLIVRNPAGRTATPPVAPSLDAASQQAQLEAAPSAQAGPVLLATESSRRADPAPVECSRIERRDAARELGRDNTGKAPSLGHRSIPPSRRSIFAARSTAGNRTVRRHAFLRRSLDRRNRCEADCLVALRRLHVGCTSWTSRPARMRITRG